jgi:enoyl-CoA hydratase/carnithine racemase
MLLSAAVLDAQTMQQRGFLNQVVGSRELAAAVAVCVQRMRPLAPQAARLNKRSFRALALVLSDNLASDLIANAYHYADSHEHREGVLAFTEKRPPQF